MANAREIQSRIKSIKDTRKITNAMYLISSTKLKKSRKLLADTEPYFYTLQGVIRRILRHMEVTEHPFFDMREDIPNGQRSRGLVVITGDKGLAGAYNHNILKLAGEWMEESGNNHLYVVGELGRQYFFCPAYSHRRAVPLYGSESIHAPGKNDCFPCPSGFYG